MKSVNILPSKLTKRDRFNDVTEEVKGRVGQLEMMSSEERQRWLSYILSDVVRSLRGENKKFNLSEDKMLGILAKANQDLSNAFAKQSTSEFDPAYVQQSVLNILTEALHSLFVWGTMYDINEDTCPDRESSAGTWSRLSQKALSILLWGGSAYTSFIWGKEAFHESLVAEKLRGKFDTDTMVGLDLGVGIAAAVAMSQIIFRFKARIADICDEQDVGFWKGAFTAYKESPIKSFASTAVLLWSVGTNISGAFSVVGTEDERMKQLAYVDQQFDKRSAILLNTKQDFSDVHAQVDQAIKTLLREEAGGGDASGAAGKGTTYFTKEQLFLDSPETKGPEGGVSEKSKKYVQTLRGILQNAQGPDGESLIDNRKLTDELINLVAEDINQLEQKLEKVKMMRTEVAFDKEINKLNSNIAEVVSVLAEAVAIRNGIEDKVNKHLAAYNIVLEDINAEARNYFNSSSDTSLKIRAQFDTVDNSNLAIEEVKYRGPLDIAGFILEEYGALLGAIVLAMASVLALSFDTLDLTLLPWERSARKKDMTKIQEKRLREAINEAQEKIANVIAYQINSGAFSNVFTSKNILATDVRKALDKVINGIIHSNGKTGPIEWAKQRLKKTKRFWSTNTAPMYDVNARIKAIKDFQENPKYLVELLFTLLPGLHKVATSVGKKDQREDMQRVKETNDAFLIASNPTAQVEMKINPSAIEKVNGQYMLKIQYSNIDEIIINGYKCGDPLKGYKKVDSDPVMRREETTCFIPFKQLEEWGVLSSDASIMKLQLVDIYGDHYLYEVSLSPDYFM